VCDRLQSRLGLEIALQPRRVHGPGRQSGDARELDEILLARIGQDALELGMRVAFERDRERRAELDGGRAQRLQPGDVVEGADATRGDDGHVVVEPDVAKQSQYLRDDDVEIEASVVEIGDLRGAQVAAGHARVLDDDGIGHALLALPLAQYDLHAARVRQDRHEQGFRMIAREIRQSSGSPAPTTTARCRTRGRA
jgi:hypothetical protein